MITETYKNEVFMAVTLLLCLWFKLDVVIVYGVENTSFFTVGTCVLFSLVILSRALWLLVTNRRKLWLILKGIFKSEMFDTISWVAFLMPFFCIEKYCNYFAYASWILGDIMLLSAFLMSQKKSK